MYSIYLEIICHLFQLTKMYKLLFILLIITLYAQINIFKRIKVIYTKVISQA